MRVAGELADDGRTLAGEGEPIAARRLSVAERVTRWVRKNPAAATAGVVTAVAVGLVVCRWCFGGCTRMRKSWRNRGLRTKSMRMKQRLEPKESETKKEVASRKLRHSGDRGDAR